MGWLQKANEWIHRPRKRAETDDLADEPALDATEAPHRLDELPPELRPTNGAAARSGPASTEVTVRYIFSLTNPGLVKPPGDGVDRREDADTPLYADLVCGHFAANRPEPASFPAMATKVIDAAEQIDADLSQLARLIEQDQAISAKVLQVANSALYHREFEITTMKSAIGHLGMFAVANVAVGVACRSLYDADARAEFELYPTRWKQLFHQSMTVAFAASEFAQATRKGRPDQVFLAGMFHDIGKALALRSLCALIIEGRINKIDDVQVDRVLERAHVQVGTEAHAAWQLPQFLSTICRRHHEDDVIASDDNVELHVIRMVSGLNALRISANFDKRLTKQVRSSVQALGIDPPRLRELTSQIREASEKVSEMFRDT